MQILLQQVSVRALQQKLQSSCLRREMLAGDELGIDDECREEPCMFIWGFSENIRFGINLSALNPHRKTLKPESGNPKAVNPNSRSLRSKPTMPRTSNPEPPRSRWNLNMRLTVAAQRLLGRTLWDVALALFVCVCACVCVYVYVIWRRERGRNLFEV